MKKLLSIIAFFTLLMYTAPAYAANIGTAEITLDKALAKTGDIIEATITLKDINAQNITAPVHFNSSVVKIVDTNGEIVQDGIKNAVQMRNGSAGITPGQAVSGDAKYWNGAIFADSANIYYPLLDNTNGFYRLLFTNTENKMITNETLIKLRFIAVGEGEADIRFAASDDTRFDPQSPTGISYSYQENIMDANKTAYMAVSVQSLTVTKSDTPITPPPTQTSGGGGGVGGGFTATIPVTPPVDYDSNTLTFEVTEQLIEENLARAADETSNSMNISITTAADVFIIKIPVSQIRREVDALVLQTLFQTPIGIIGIENIKTLEYTDNLSQWVTLRLSGFLDCKIDLDGKEIQGLILGFPTTQTGATAFYCGNPILKSRFDGEYLIFNADENGSYELDTRTLPFSDVDFENWAYPYIQSLWHKSIAAGVSETMYEPDFNITREQFAKLLVCALGIYDETAVCDFSDVAAESWAYPYVASAAKAGIITGYDTGDFGTGRNITRQEMAVMIFRTGTKFPYRVQPHDFTDQSNIAGWAAEAVKTMRQADIINGFEDGSFRPLDNATRAQAAKIIFCLLSL